MSEWKENMQNWTEIKWKIVNALNKLYREDECLFTRNNGRGLAERCIVFRFAHDLQNEFDDYSVDCDFNSASVNSQDVSGKPITNSDGWTVTNRFIDIIIHKRTREPNSNNLICFEIKKWDNRKRESIEKDKNNLRALTCGYEYGYQYCFHIIIGKTIDRTTIEIFERDGTECLLTWEDFRNG